MQSYKCYNEHTFDTDDVESYFPKCPRCGASAKPQDKEPDLFVQSTVLEDLAMIDSILAEANAAESPSVPDAGGFSGFDGGDSGGGGASDSFDAGGGDASV